MRAQPCLGPATTVADAAPAPPCTIVIFGAAGDLARRLLIPALYNLAARGLLSDRLGIVGVSRNVMPDEAFRDTVRAALRNFATDAVEPDVAEALLGRLFHVAGDFADPETYRRLTDRLADVAGRFGTDGNVLFYLATPPAAFAPIVRNLGASGLTREKGGVWRRVVVEKPFGTDLASARSLNAELQTVLDEHQIYRIDHYLGKETVQNIMVARFANGLFEPLWNRNHVDHVQITVGETVSVERRGRFYDATGALRDMVPNHLFQLLALTAMEPPTCFDADAVHTEKAKVFDAIHRFTPEEVATNVVRAQYGAGTVTGKPVAAYRESLDVAADSRTETFVAMRLLIDNWRWAGVPFYLRTGKSLAARRTEIAVGFKQAPYPLFRNTPVERLADNVLVIGVQPDEAITLQFNAKVPGPRLRIDGVRMVMEYKDYFRAAPSTGYETLIYDGMAGDQTQFQRADYVEAGWAVVQPILDAWRARSGDGLAAYPAGSQGPREADDLLARDGRRWRPVS
ncbi:glucose-6-phosphate dehydrogenase [Azospirillum sp.]|uniref:glucose-6-phosphate dehydrogenase n=1 Tax=Azospirillum sp. TaxID=34012 RepID=UPI003D732A29